MAKTTVNVQKLKSTASELDQISANIGAQIKKMDEHISTLQKVWQGEAAKEHIAKYNKHSDTFKAMSKAIKDAAATLNADAAAYGQAEAQTSDAIDRLLR